MTQSVTDPGTDPVLPIRRSAAGIQAKHAGMVAEHLGLGRLALQVDMTDQDQVKAMLEELGPDIPMPEDPEGVYYVFYAFAINGDIIPMVVSEVDMPPKMAGMAAAHGAEQAYQLQYRASVFPIPLDKLRPPRKVRP